MPEADHSLVKLADELPELVAYIRAGLEQQGRGEIVSDIESAYVYDASAATHHGGLDLIPDLDAAAMMSHPERERIWIGAPRGVPRRQWAVTLEVILGRTWSIAISHPGILREPLRRLGHRTERRRSRVIRRR